MHAHSAAAGKKPDFKTFLLFNPLLTNGGLFLHYYSKDLMLNVRRAWVFHHGGLGVPSCLIPCCRAANC